TMATLSRSLASDLLALFAQLGLSGAIHRRKSTPSKVAPELGNKSSSNTVYDVCLRGELTQLREFRDMLEQNSDEDAHPKLRINSKYLAIPREIITDDLRRIIRRFNQGKGTGRFGDFYWGCKRITYPGLSGSMRPSRTALSRQHTYPSTSRRRPPNSWESPRATS